MPEDTSPETIEHENNGSPEQWRTRLRISFAVILTILLIGWVFLYSLYEAEHSRIEGMQRQLERNEIMLMDVLVSHDSRKKLEKIELQITGIESQLDDLTKQLKQETHDTEVSQLKR